MKAVASLLAAAAAAVPLAACVPEEAVQPEMPPEEVGGRLTIGGFSIGPKGEAYGYKGELSPQEQKLREQGRNFDRTVWEGVLIGAVAGSVIGTLVGGDEESAAGGAIVGGGIGALVGIYVAEKQKRYASTEDQLDSMIADVRTSNVNTQALIADAKIVLEEDRRRLRALQAQERKGKATQAELQKRARALANRKVITDAVAGARVQHEMYSGARQSFVKSNPGTPTGAFEKELQSYRQSIDQLDAVAESMVQA
jgi:hypothetical protein